MNSSWAAVRPRLLARYLDVNVYFVLLMCLWVLRPAMNAIRVGPMSLPYAVALAAPLAVMALTVTPVYLVRRAGMALVLLLFGLGVWHSACISCIMKA